MSDFSGSMGSLSIGDDHHPDFDVAEWMGYGAAHHAMEVQQAGQFNNGAQATAQRPAYVPPSPQVLHQRGRFICSAIGLVLSGLLGVAGGYTLSAHREVVGGVLIGLAGLGLGCSAALCCLRGQNGSIAGSSPV